MLVKFEELKIGEKFSFKTQAWKKVGRTWYEQAIGGHTLYRMTDTDTKVERLKK